MSTSFRQSKFNKLIQLLSSYDKLKTKIESKSNYMYMNCEVSYNYMLRCIPVAKISDLKVWCMLFHHYNSAKLKLTIKKLFLKGMPNFSVLCKNPFYSYFKQTVCTLYCCRIH